MGRRPLYLTPEAKRDANRAKSRRSYETHQTSINERRRARYQPNTKITVARTSAANIDDSSNLPESAPGVAYCVGRIQHIQENISKVLNHQPPPLYIDAVRSAYMLTRDIANIQKAVHKMRHHQARIIGPTSKEWMDADVVRRNVGLIIEGLEDLEIHVMMGVDELDTHYKTGRLIYQTW
ncbi:hypothetical protein BDZ94DRAFT_1237765 [Collybia nuda]|uniref:Uncharacterized protein n=1 Tax=Collybia nuda TaxID=64659 RepID=A0A9P6CGM7_9AGAR|nr:hypothetical protein BDZ94DRAFT_1237765 [Collybia nuda]